LQTYIQASREVEDAHGRQMVIMRCIGCNLSLKEIKECVQLYLHESFKSVTFLMRGFLEITFTKEVSDDQMERLFFLFLQMDHAFQRFIAGGKSIINTYDQNTIPGY
jgi:hypothetical protein